MIKRKTDTGIVLRILSYLLIAVTVALFARFIVSLWQYTVDDAFITFRYSRHLASGYGANWNIGGVHAEGYTTFLWMLIMAVPHFFNLDILVTSKIIGILCMLAGACMVWLFTSQSLPESSKLKTLSCCLAVMLFTALPATAIHSVSGMETALYTMLMTLFMYLSYSILKFPGKRSSIYGLAITGLLLGITRPEGNLAAIAGMICVLALMDKGHRRQLLASGLILYILPSAIYFIIRFKYYGLLFPIPFYIKVTGKFDPLLQWEGPIFSSITRNGMVPLKILEFSNNYYLWVMGFRQTAVARELSNWPVP